MTIRTTVEMISESQAVLGTDYGLAFHHSCQELWRISSAWDRYEALFCTQERVDLLNKSGGVFWHTIQDMMFEHVLLGLCRMTDTAGTGQRRNLSVWRLVELDKSPNNKRLTQRAKTAQQHTEFARTWRDKRIAHNDFEQMTGLANKLLPATRNKVTRAIISIHDVLRWIHAKHFGGELYLSDMGDSDAITVMSHIADAVKFETLRSISWSSGNFDPIYNHDFDWMKSAPDPARRYKRQQRLKLPRSKRAIV